jgi:peptide/nickel transport system substrate-binding protein
MRANKSYYQGAPFIDQIVIEPYASVRSAWADMLRGRVDMLYEVGVEAIDSLQPSRDAEIFISPRPYALMAILNVEKPQLRDASFRRALNAAVNRQALVDDALNGHGSPAESPVWPHHWAHDSSLPRFTYEPRAVSLPLSKSRFTVLYTEPSHERVALTLQRQLQAVGVNVSLETAPLDEALARVRTGDFDAFLADAVHGPTLVRPSLFWHSRAPLNWGHFRSTEVDAALDAIRHAPDDEAYKVSVAAFQRAIVNDPPAIFLTWGERARAVSTRFEVPAEPGHDILPTTLRLWRPRSDTRFMSKN